MSGSSSTTAARLLRRLEDAGADDARLANLTESFCMIGTPLPALDSSKRDANEYEPIWKQEVRDEKGRRRFHGAFTGGFSAGYFNTVGSVDGWTPASFKSSRADKKDKERARESGRESGKGKVGSRPEDFMDEEDLADWREKKTLEATADDRDRDRAGSSDADRLGFGTLGELQSRAVRDDESLDNSLADIVAPVSSGLGVRLLRRMGWREGQGLGPRVSAAKRTVMRRQLGLPSDSGEDEHGEEEKKHLFAPPDTPLVVFTSKDDAVGLGYNSGPRLVDLVREPSPSRPTKGPAGAGSRRDAFGLSVFEDASDDEDIYSSTARPTDVTDRLGSAPYGPGMSVDDDDGDVLRFGRHGRRDGAERGNRMDRHGEIPATFHDGRPVLRGFVLASKPAPQQPWFEPPKMPNGWRPDPQRLWEMAKKARREKENVAPGVVPAQRASNDQASQLGPDERGAILREAKLEAPPRSVFQYLSQKDKDRLAALGRPSSTPPRGRGHGPPGPPPPPPGGARQLISPADVQVPRTDPATAAAALKGYMPFSDDLIKQARYKAYLTSQANPPPSDPETDRPPPLPFFPPPSMKLEELQRELSDFAKSAAMFRPISSMMASRFTTATTEHGNMDGRVPQAGLHVPDTAAEAARTATADGKPSDRLQPAKEETPREKAVREGNFGPLTRTVKNIYPVRLFCKRFNVPDPHPGGPEVEDEDEGPGFQFGGAKAQAASKGGGGRGGARHVDDWKGGVEREMQMAAANRSWQAATPSTGMAGQLGGGGAPSSSSATPSKEGTPTLLPTLANVGLGDDELQGRDILTYEKPSLDIFKAIFADEDEDEDEDDEDDEDDKDEEERNERSARQGSQPVQVAGNINQPLKSPHPHQTDDEPADPSKPFKPTFVPRAKRPVPADEDGGGDVSFGQAVGATAKRAKAAAEDEEEGRRRKEKKREKKKKEKKGRGMVSFDLEEEEEPQDDSDRVSKRRKAESNGKDRRKDEDLRKDRAREGKGQGEEKDRAHGPTAHAGDGEDARTSAEAVSSATADAGHQHRRRAKAADLF